MKFDFDPSKRSLYTFRIVGEDIAFKAKNFFSPEKLELIVPHVMANLASRPSAGFLVELERRVWIYNENPKNTQKLLFSALECLTKIRLQDSARPALPIFVREDVTYNSIKEKVEATYEAHVRYGCAIEMQTELDALRQESLGLALLENFESEHEKARAGHKEYQEALSQADQIEERRLSEATVDVSKELLVEVSQEFGENHAYTILIASLLAHADAKLLSYELTKSGIKLKLQRAVRLVPHLDKRLFLPLVHASVPVSVLTQDSYAWGAGLEHDLLTRECYDGLPASLDVSLLLGPDVEFALVEGRLEPRAGVDLRWNVTQPWKDAIDASLKRVEPHLDLIEKAELKLLRMALRNFEGFDRSLKVKQVFAGQVFAYPFYGSDVLAIKFDLDSLINDILSLPLLPKILLAGSLKKNMQEVTWHVALRKNAIAETVAGLDALCDLPSEQLIDALSQRAFALVRQLEQPASNLSKDADDLRRSILRNPAFWVTHLIEYNDSEAALVEELESVYRTLGGTDLFLPAQVSDKATGDTVRRLAKMGQFITAHLL